MKTKTINIYSYTELSDKAAEKARDNWRQTQLDYDWWEFIYDDAERVGIKITGFDIYRHEISGEFIESADYTADKILKDHGDKGGTWSEANSYKEDMARFMEKHADADGELPTYALENEKEDMERDFLRAILEEYLTMLRNEEEYQMSDDVIAECIIMNDMEYLEDGTIA